LLRSWPVTHSIDLIPDFVPLIGYLDDLIIVPVGILIVVWMIPEEIMAEHRASAEAAKEKPVSRVAATIIIGVWILVAAAAGWIAIACFLQGSNGEP
jgi:uncharacterized membrane protein YkvA (DUF1232 family)